MKKEVLAIIGPVEDLGDGIFEMAGLCPEVLRMVIIHGGEIAGIPWDILKEYTEQTAGGVDYVVESVIK